MCKAKNEGLVHYPTTLVAVGEPTVQCVDNAHIKPDSSLNVRCGSNGSWSGDIPVCECDDGHHVTTDEEGREAKVSKMFMRVFVCINGSKVT